jgi:hypothetical protein
MEQRSNEQLLYELGYGIRTNKSVQQPGADISGAVLKQSQGAQG